MTKLKWRVGEAPTGQYKSFFKRSWPSAELEDGRPAFSIICEDSYVPADVKTGKHAELKINVADWSEKEGTFVWKTLKQRAETLAEAKNLAQKFADKFPEVFVVKKNI